MEKDRLNGRVRILRDGHGGYGLDISGDVNAYVVIDAIAAVTKANAQERREVSDGKRLNFLIKALTTGVTAITALSLILFLFGGCQPKSQYVHPTQHYQGNW